MNFDQLVNTMTPEVYENLKRAVELGKWPDGRSLTPEQKQSCMQGIIAYEHLHMAPEERTGYIAPKPHQHCGGEGDVSDSEEAPLKWQ